VADDNRDLLIAGLKDAYAVKTQALDMMRMQHRRLDKYPELKVRVGKHVTETENQMKRLEECLAKFNESPSTIKDTAMRLVGNVQSMFHATAEDEVIKNMFANNAFENFEIATYKGLAAMAEAVGAHDVADAARQSLHEEEDMARFVSEHIEQTVREYMAMRESGEEASTGVV